MDHQYLLFGQFKMRSMFLQQYNSSLARQICLQFVNLHIQKCTTHHFRGVSTVQQGLPRFQGVSLLSVRFAHQQFSAAVRQLSVQQSCSFGSCFSNKVSRDRSCEAQEMYTNRQHKSAACSVAEQTEVSTEHAAQPSLS